MQKTTVSRADSIICFIMLITIAWAQAQYFPPSSGGAGRGVTIRHEFTEAGAYNYVHNLNSLTPITSCYANSGSSSFSYEVVNANTVAVTASAAADISCAFMSGGTIYIDSIVPIVVSAPGYVHGRQIKISVSKVPTDQTNFPVLVSITDATLISIANGGSFVTSANGYDIIFAANPDGTSPLIWEVESYNPVTGKLVAWVRMNLTHASGGLFYMFYGNALITTFQSTPTSTWAAYVGVWHLTSLTADAKGVNTLTSTAVSTNTGGIAGGAASFNGTSSHLTNTAPTGIPNTFPLTLELWIKPTALPTPTAAGYLAQVSKYAGSAHSLFHLIEPNQAVNPGAFAYFQGDAIHATASGLDATGVWEYLAIVFENATTVRFYLNGTSAAIGQPSGAFAVLGTQVNLGAIDLDTTPTYANFYNGLMDEFRVASVALSADWIAMVHNTIANPGTFINVGAQQ